MSFLLVNTNYTLENSGGAKPLSGCHSSIFAVFSDIILYGIYSFISNLPQWMRMHREIMNNPQLQVDHINHNKLDNCKSNLRIVTNAQNMQNTSGWNSSTSSYRGVSWGKTRKKWRASVMLNGKQVFHKRYSTEQEAIDSVMAYRKIHMPYSIDAV